MVGAVVRGRRRGSRYRGGGADRRRGPAAELRSAVEGGLIRQDCWLELTASHCHFPCREEVMFYLSLNFP